MHNINIPSVIYLDHNATTLPDPAVLELFNTIASYPLNPSSTHTMGRFASSLVAKARNQIREACCLNNEYNVYFTSTGTESNNLLMYNFCPTQVFISAIEHPSLMEYKGRGAGIISVDNQGKLNLEHLEYLLASNTDCRLVSIMLANNETGVVQNLESISNIVKKFNILLHTDASQALGKLSLASLHYADYITVCSHKVGGLAGAAALICKKGISIKPHIIGGGQEQYVRSGTENVASISAFGLAALIAHHNHQERITTLQTMRDTLEAELMRLKPDVVIASCNSTRLPNTSLIMIPGFNAQRLLIELDLRKIALSAGSACASGKVQKSHVLQAMGFAEELLSCAIRVSLSHHNNINDIYLLIKNLAEIMRVEL